ncbi:hypothetical protein [Rothia nasimurium]|uniref:hypothetical protein n=1 Tax=Rothia nasimurium TaxID=85336 RepID=UPI00162422BA|nr:hypothetical protein [Rothia nasimurium]
MKVEISIKRSGEKTKRSNRISEVNQLLEYRGLPGVGASLEEQALVDSAYTQTGAGAVFQRASIIIAIALVYTTDVFAEIYAKQADPTTYPKLFMVALVIVLFLFGVRRLFKRQIPRMQAAKAVELIIMYRANSPVRPEI